MNLKKWREGAGLDQQGAADRVGVTRGSWANYESGRRPTPPGVLAIISASGVDIEQDPAPVIAAPPKLKARTGDVAAPVRIVGQTPRGLNIGEDGRLYGHFERVADKPALAKVLQGTGARWVETFPSANGYGSGSSIMWGVLKGEAESDCAPVLAGRHYAPHRANVRRMGGDPLPKGA